MSKSFTTTRSQFRGFLNQVRLVIQMHPSRYPTDASRVGLIGMLLSGSTLAWFGPLLEKQSLLLNNFEDFISEFKACFGDIDNIRTTINKIGHDISLVVSLFNSNSNAKMWPNPLLLLLSFAMWIRHRQG